jgi:translation initiation factor IF-3
MIMVWILTKLKRNNYQVMQTNNNQQQFRVRINQHIRVPQVRVILSNGDNGGIMATYEALKLAKTENLDLVEINPKAAPPVVKICDYGKMKYEEKKQQQAAKKKQVVQELKELTFRPNTDTNDLEHKLAQAKGFLEEGNKVKFTVRFRGREITHSELGRNKLEWFMQQLQGLITDKSQISLEGKFMSVIVSPTKKQA